MSLVRISPSPQHSPTTAVPRREAPPRSAGTMGRGGGRCDSELIRGRGDAATGSRTVSTLLVVVVLPTESVSPAPVGSPRSRALLSWMNFPYALGILISSPLGGLPCRSGGSPRATLPSSSCYCQGPAGQRRAASFVRPTFPTWDPQSWPACPLCWRKP